MKQKNILETKDAAGPLPPGPLSVPFDVKTEPVRVRVEDLVIPTYLPAPPDKNPMFLEKRVYQGSSGKVYPFPLSIGLPKSR